MCTLRTMTGGHKGLTLMELMIVIAILAIMAGMSMSALGNYIPDYRLQSAARELYANMHKAKMEAIKRNANVRVVFDADNSMYDIRLDSGKKLKVVSLSKYEQVDYGAGNALYDATTNKKALPEDYVSFNLNIVSFNPYGTGGTGYVYLDNLKGESYAVGALSSGVVLIKRWKNDDWYE